MDKKTYLELVAITEHYNQMYKEHISIRQMMVYLIRESIRNTYIRMQSGKW